MKTLPPILTAIIVGVVWGVAGSVNTLPLVTVTSGELNVKLTCPPLHQTPLTLLQSVLWLVGEEGVEAVGAEAHYDHAKYRYLASTGQLLIKQVTAQDGGVYRCVVRLRREQGQQGVVVRSSGLLLKVKVTYSNVWEQEFKEHAIRGGVAAGLTLGTLMAACLVYSCRYKEKGGVGVVVTGNRGCYNITGDMMDESTCANEVEATPTQTIQQGRMEMMKKKKMGSLTLPSPVPPHSPPLPMQLQPGVGGVGKGTDKGVSVGVNTELEAARQGSTVIYITPSQ